MNMFDLGVVDRLEKTASFGRELSGAAKDIGKVGLGFGAVLLALKAAGPKLTRKEKEKIKEDTKREFRDPRLYSNIRGGLTLESSKQRVAAHKGLKKSDGTIFGAMRSGFKREQR